MRQVVATAGTALTEPNLKALSRFTGDIRLCFDADKAGINATERAIPIASRVKISLNIITIPSGKDPDELIKQDVHKWQEIIQKHQYALDWLMERYEKLLNVRSAEGKRQFSDVLLPIVRSLNDPVEQDHYMVAIADTIGVSKEALNTKLSQTKGVAEPIRQRKPRVVPQQLDKAAVEHAKAQDHFLSLMLLQPKLREYLNLIQLNMLTGEERRELFKFLREHPDFSGQPEKVQELKNIGDYVKIQSLLYEELYQGLELTELQYEAARLQARLVERFVKQQKQKIAHELEAADESAVSTLLERAKQYDALLKEVQGGRNG